MKSKPYFRFMLLVLILAVACLLGASVALSSGYPITAGAVWRSGVFFLLLDVLYGVLLRWVEFNSFVYS